MGKNLDVNVVLAERLLVLPQSQTVHQAATLMGAFPGPVPLAEARSFFSLPPNFMRPARSNARAAHGVKVISGALSRH